MRKPYSQIKTVTPEEKFLRFLDKRGEDERWSWKVGRTWNWVKLDSLSREKING
jgi:hypothetical protein